MSINRRNFIKLLGGATLLALKIARTFRKPVEAIFALEEGE